MTLHTDTPARFADLHNGGMINPPRESWLMRNARPLVWWPIIIWMACCILAIGYAVTFYALPALFHALLWFVDALFLDAAWKGDW